MLAWHREGISLEMVKIANFFFFFKFIYLFIYGCVGSSFLC